MQPRLIRFALACWTLGAALGAGFNAVLGALSPAYFRRVMGWDFPGIGSAAVLQGLLEGTVYGLLVALVLGGRWLRTKSPLAVLLPLPLWSTLAALAGGLLGAGLAALNPPYFTATFPAADGLFGPSLTAFGAVGGAINGALLGAAFGTLATWSRLRTP